MKSNIVQHKLLLAQKAENELPHLMVNYQTGDLISLGKLCNAISVLAEFYEDNLETDFAKRVPRLTDYLGNKFKNMICLLLKKDESYYAYTPNNVTKFIRGETIHGASEIRDQKRRTLHDYVFEKDNDIDWEFQISWNVVAGPNLRSSEGNTDSGGPYKHVVKLNENESEVSTIESVILNIAFELWQANTNQKPSESTKVFVKFNPLWYVPVWGEELAMKIKSHLETFYGFELPELNPQ